MAASGGTKAVVAALAANLTIAVFKFIAWIPTQSSSMLSQAIRRAGAIAAAIHPEPRIHRTAREANGAALPAGA